MRGFLSIVRATALEVLSEPLTLLTLLAALTLTVLAPAFHYHQFGESTRMARDAGFSSLFVCGAILAVFATIRTIRREIETGTMEMALAHAISRTEFFFAKVVGVSVAWLAFAFTILLTMFVIVEGAAIGGEISRRTGDIARVWGPSLAAGVGVILLPLLVGASLNRFGRFRFVLTASFLSLLLSALFGVAALVFGRTALVRLASAALPLCLPAAVLLSASAAFSFRLRANAAAAATGVVFVLLLPAVGNWYLADALSNGGAVPLSAVGMSFLAAVPAVGFFVLLGLHFINASDLT